MKYFLMIL